MAKLEIVSASPLFEMLSNQELASVADLCRVTTLGAGQVVFEEGDLEDGLYVIASGEVEVLARDPSGELKLLAVLGASDCFGEMDVIDKESRSATVRARSEAELLHLTAEDLAHFRERHRDGFGFLVMNIARVLSGRLREANRNALARRVDGPGSGT